VAVNCWVRPVATLRVVGATWVVMSAMAKGNEPTIEESAVNVAVTVPCEPAVAGATYTAVAGVGAGVVGVRVPGPVKLQVTAVVDAFDTVAVSVTVWVG